MGRLIPCFALAVLLGAACSDSSSDGPNGGDAGNDGMANGDGAGGDALSDGATDAAGHPDAATDGDSATGPFVLMSTSFSEGGVMLPLQACPMNVSPALSWSGAPAGTQSYAIVMRDETLVLMGQAAYHWIIYDIPATTTSLSDGIDAVAAPPTPAGAKQTYWSFGANYSYRGPCPPMGDNLHTYRFTIYSFASPMINGSAEQSDPTIVDSVIQQKKTASATTFALYSR